MAKRENSINYTDGYVAFIDILGFSNYVLEENNLEKVSDLFQFVDKFCYLFNTSFKLNVNASFFSDSIVLSSNEFRNLIAPIFIAENYLKNELGLLFRGGIAKGKYFHSNDVTFGPAVVNAYYLEKQALYSRIIIDNEIIRTDIGQNYIETFQDIDGRWCLNLYALVVFDEVAFGPTGAVYPDGDLGEIILTSLKKHRNNILDSINKYMCTAVVDKYTWRIRPFNFTCEQFAKDSSTLQGDGSCVKSGKYSHCYLSINLFADGVGVSVCG